MGQPSDRSDLVREVAWAALLLGGGAIMVWLVYIFLGHAYWV